MKIECMCNAFVNNTYSDAFMKYSRASEKSSFFSNAWPTLLNSLAFLWLTFKAERKMLYSVFLGREYINFFKHLYCWTG